MHPIVTADPAAENKVDLSPKAWSPGVLQAHKRGGSAVDAALTTALTQVAHHMGGATSYAGHMSLVYFHAATGEVQFLDAQYSTVLGEDDPLTIPPFGTLSGRAVLVPGLMAGGVPTQLTQIARST